MQRMSGAKSKSHVSSRQLVPDRLKAQKGFAFDSAKWIVAAFITFFILPLMFKPMAKVFSRKHSLTGFVDNGSKNSSCTVWTLSIFPIESIKSLNMIVHLDRPIPQNILQNGLDVNQNPTQSVHVKVNDACKILTESSGVNDSLTFTLSSDRREIVIKGHDLSRYDAQTFVGAFHQNGTAHPELDVTGDATYEAFGYEFPAKIQLIDQQSGKDLMIQ